MNDVVCIGMGYVGQATAYAFGIKDHFTRHDATLTLEEANNKRYIFICLPTPTVQGKCDTSAIFALLTQLSRYPRKVDNMYIIRSTVYPGFANYAMKELGIDNIVSNPEFLSEDTWKEDALKPKLVVIGSEYPKYRERLKGLYEGRYKYSEPLITDNITAEMIKYAMNTWFSTKVIFSNEIFNICEKTGANYETVKTALQTHPWGLKNHNIIHYKGKRGIHGSCLPKDLEAFANFTDSQFFRTLLTLNEQYK